MRNDSPDGAAVRIPPPLVFVAAVVVGSLCKAFVMDLPTGLPATLRILLAVLTGLGGVALMAGAIGLFRRTGQDPKPWKETPELIFSGVYRLTRNPMYVAMALLQVAIGLGLANGWILLLFPVSIVVVQQTAIRHEEAYLERKFGAPYVEYKSTVRRWL